MNSRALKRNPRDEALRRLGITADATRGIPQVFHILSEADGGIERVITALRGYDDDDAQVFVEKWDSVSRSDKKRVSLEEIAIAAGVGTLDLLACATKALFIENQTISSIIASTSHPEIVRKTVDQAKEPGGYRDREMLHTAMGFLPTPKGSVFISNRVQVANFKGGDAGEAGDDKPNAPADVPDFPDMDEDILGMDAHEKKLLEGPK